MTAPTDAVAQARANIHLDLTMSSEADVDALIVAVRAECADRVRETPAVEESHSHYRRVEEAMRTRILAALEAKP